MKKPAVLLALGGALIWGATLEGGICPTAGTCSTDASCVAVATSLRPANGPKEDVGWNADGGACGVNKDTGKACGAKLGDSVCGADDFTGPNCDPLVDLACCATDDTECILNQLNSLSLRQPPATPRAAAPPELVTERLQQAAALELPGEVERLLVGLAGVRSIHLKARLQISGPAPGQSDLTTYEYWEAGERYRIHTDIDPRLDLLDIPDLAYDGSHHQMLLRSHLRTVLSLTAKDTRRTYVGFPNPLLLPLFFFSPEDVDRCALCDLRLADVRWLAAHRTPSRSAAKTAKLSLPGGRVSGQPTTFEVTLDETGRSAEIRRITATGTCVAVVKLDRYLTVSGGAFEFPRRLDWTRNDASGKPVTTLKVAIDELEINRPLDPSIFTLSFDLAEKVLDSDADRWLKVSPKAPTCIR